MAVFMMNFQKIFRTAFLQEHLWTAVSIVLTLQYKTIN